VEAAQERHPGRIQFGLMPRRRLPFPSVVVASRNDPYMPWTKTQEHAGIWGVGIIDLGYAGHINVASGFGRWPEGYALASGLDRSGSADQPEYASGLWRGRHFRPRVFGIVGQDWDNHCMN
jgi:uncharacterized protein